MSGYEVDADELFSDDEHALPSPSREDESESPPPPPKRPRPSASVGGGGGSRLDSLSSLNLSSFGRGRPPPQRTSAPHHQYRSNGFGGYGRGPPRGRGGPSVGAMGGNGPIGDHMRMGAPAPAKGRPGIHPSRLANINAQRGSSTRGMSSSSSYRTAPDDDEDAAAVSREEQRQAAYSILSEADRQLLNESEETGGGADGGGSATRRRRPSRRLLNPAMASVEAAREREKNAWANKAREDRRKGFGKAGVDLAALMARTKAGSKRRVQSSGAPRRDGAAERERKKREAYMEQVLGPGAVAREKARVQREKDERIAEIAIARHEAKRSRMQDCVRWRADITVARRMRDSINLALYERQQLFAGADRLKMGNNEPFGLKLKTLETDDEVERICFVEMNDDLM